MGHHAMPGYDCRQCIWYKEEEETKGGLFSWLGQRRRWGGTLITPQNTEEEKQWVLEANIHS